MSSGIPKTMQAVAVKKYGTQLEIIELPVPEPKSNEVLIKVHASGLCSTDLHLLNGRQSLGDLPRVLGHETAGEIVSLGKNVTNWKEGNRVVVAIDEICGQCVHCLTGQHNAAQTKPELDLNVMAVMLILWLSHLGTWFYYRKILVIKKLRYYPTPWLVCTTRLSIRVK